MNTATPIATLGERTLYPDVVGDASVIDQVWSDLANRTDEVDPNILGEFAHDTTRCSIGFLALWKLQPEVIQDITSKTWETLSANTSSSADLGRAYSLARAISWNVEILKHDNHESISAVWDTRRRAAAQSIATLLAETRASADYIPHLETPGNIFDVAGGFISLRGLHFMFAPEMHEPFLDNYIELGWRGVTRIIHTDRELSIKTFEAMQEAVRREKPKDSDKWELFGALDVVRYSATDTKYALPGPTGPARQDTFIPLMGWVEVVNTDETDHTSS
jgi:hypothetical protein